jgi:hypothetical protein
MIAAFRDFNLLLNSSWIQFDWLRLFPNIWTLQSIFNQLPSQMMHIFSNRYYRPLSHEAKFRGNSVNSGNTVIPRLTKIIRSEITFVSRNVISHRLSAVSLLAVSKVNNPVGLVGLPYVMWSAHFFVTHKQTEKISSWNGPTVHVRCFMLARASTITFVRRVRKTAKKSSLTEKFVSRVTR